MLSEISFGSVNIPIALVMLLAGTVAMTVVLWQRRLRFALSGLSAVLFGLLLTVCGVAGTKLLYIAENWQKTLEEGISFGGMSFYGAVWLIPLLMPLIGRMFKLRAAQSMDLCAPCVAVMIGCMRLSCFLSGCCGGWEMCLGSFCFQWPTQALESIGDFAIFAWLMQKEETDPSKGKLYPLFMISYSAMRFCLEFLRDTPKDWIFMSHGQWFAIVSVLLGLLWLTVLKRKSGVNEVK